MRFNVNHKVKVRLTERGRELIKLNHDALWRDMPAMVPCPTPAEDRDGWSEWQLWSLMQEFGRHIHNGCNVPFETEIDIPEHQH